jgi:hypothetical protein
MKHARGMFLGSGTWRLALEVGPGKWPALNLMDAGLLEVD